MNIEDRIQKELSRLESEKNITIIHAVESGSRAWGFPSPDSDYDVRFLYAHPTDWYLSVRERRDVVEMPIDDVLDISGWDIRKAFRLLTKSNGALYEWLSSPIIYRTHVSAIEPIQQIAPEIFNPEAMFYHYYAMAKRKYLEILEQDQAKLKTYLYALRPLLACRWIVDNRVAPPMEFSVLKEQYIDDKGELAELLDKLLEEKRRTIEGNKRQRVPLLDEYLAAGVKELEGAVGSYKNDIDWQRIDEQFRETLKRAAEQSSP